MRDSGGLRSCKKLRAPARLQAGKNRVQWRVEGLGWPCPPVHWLVALRRGQTMLVRSPDRGAQWPRAPESPKEL